LKGQIPQHALHKIVDIYNIFNQKMIEKSMLEKNDILFFSKDKKMFCYNVFSFTIHNMCKTLLINQNKEELMSYLFREEKN
jgi:hypothetical protein